MTDLVPLTDPIPGLLASWFSGISERSRTTYSDGLRQLAAFLGVESPADACRLLLVDRGKTYETLKHWQGAMKASGNSGATINVRLSAVRSLLAEALTAGHIDWSIRLKGEPRGRVRDVSAPILSAFVSALANEPAARDRLLLRLLGVRGLRISSCLTLDMEHVSGDRRKLFVRMKGNASNRRWVTIDEDTSHALEEWLSVRGFEAGPLFTSWHKVEGTREPARLSYTAANRLVRRHDLGSCHRLRHLCAALSQQVSGGAIDPTRKLLGHASESTTRHYLAADGEDDAEHVSAVAALVRA